MPKAQAEEVRSQGLGDMLSDISDFISLVDGQSFEGVFVKGEKVQSRFDADKETLELTFNIGGKDKTCSGVRLAREIFKAGIVEGGKVKVTRVSTKGTKVDWKVEKVA
ncbi:MAG: hypothetical protein AAB922_01410 [Patescibacteria group bacterium]